MKQILNIITAIILVSFVAGCAGTKVTYLEPEKFMEKAKAFDTSVTTTTYLGTSQDRIYYEFCDYVTITDIFKISDKPKRTIYWTELEKISQENIDQLNSRKREKEQLKENSKVIDIRGLQLK